MRLKGIETLLQQNFSEKFFIVYLSEMADTYGSSVAAESALEKDSIKESISSYTRCSLKERVNDLDLQLAILRNVVLSPTTECKAVEYAKRQISDENIEGLLQDMSSCVFLKRDLLIYFVEHSYLTPKQAYEKASDKDRIYQELTKIDRYKMNRLKKEKTDSKKLELTQKKGDSN